MDLVKHTFNDGKHSYSEYTLGIIGLRLYYNGHHYFHTKTEKAMTNAEMRKISKRWREFHTKLLPYWKEIRPGEVSYCLVRELLEASLGYEDHWL